MLILYLQSAVPTAGAVDFLWHSNEYIYEDRSRLGRGGFSWLTRLALVNNEAKTLLINFSRSRK